MGSRTPVALAHAGLDGARRYSPERRPRASLLSLDAVGPTQRSLTTEYRAAMRSSLDLFPSMGARPATAPATTRGAGAALREKLSAAALLSPEMRAMAPQHAPSAMARAAAAARRPATSHGSSDAALPSLRDAVPAWCTRADEVREAGDAFVSRHAKRRAHAKTALRDLRATGGAGQRQARSFEKSVEEIRYNRFYLDASAIIPARPPVDHHRAPPTAMARIPWKLEESIWAPRKESSDAKDFYDTDAVGARAIARDWRAALKVSRLEAFINKVDDGDSDDELEEVDEVRDVFADHHQLVYGLFDYYAAVGASDDIFHIGLNGYHQLVDELHLARKGSKHCEKQHLELIFTQVDSSHRLDEKMAKGDDGAAAAPPPAPAPLARRASAASGPFSRGLVRQKTTAIDRRGSTDERKRLNHFNQANAINRQELLRVLVRIAVARYVLSRRESDVSNALQKLLADELRRHAPPAALADRNTFRQRHCYTEPVDKVLRRHEPSLRALYGRWAAGNTYDKARERAALSYPEWMAMCEQLELIDAVFTVRRARLVFLWSRMRVVNEASGGARLRVTHLLFEDFLEAIVRVALAKALPTDAEVRAEGCSDAGEYMIGLREHPDRCMRFVHEQSAVWDAHDSVNAMPRQPAASCVEALVWLIVRTVKGQPTGPLSGSTTLSDHDVGRFMAGDRGGARPTVRRASTMAAGAMGAAMAKKEPVVLSPRSHDRAVLAALDHESPRGEMISAFVGNS